MNSTKPTLETYIRLTSFHIYGCDIVELTDLRRKFEFRNKSST